jgi:outer membrane protein OmpA-like peptidoglycan-associated protein/ABC-type nitrate/sulfonate/bicarbonate transport system substrate-binding protein
MNRNFLAAFLILMIGLLCIAAYKIVNEKLVEKSQTAASDAKSRLTIHMAGDGYLGYFFITSPEMKRQLAKRGITVDFTNDGGAYAERLEKFSAGTYDGIVLPINSYIEHGAKHKYPGVIVAAIAESKGADAIVGFSNKLKTGKLSDLNDASLKIVYTGQSPSSFLLDLTIVDFDLYNLSRTDAWRKEVGGSTDAFKMAKARDGDVFVMWEPDVSRALREVSGLKQIWGSDGFSGYIVDVFVFRRDFVDQHHDDLVSFFEAYFTAMRSYAVDHERLMEDMKVATGLKVDEVDRMLSKIDWYDFQANAHKQFGLKGDAGTEAVEGVVNTIIACTNILVKTGKFPKDPLGDPYKIINTSILQDLQKRLPQDAGSVPGKREFAKLGESQWRTLKELGVMRVEPITFQQGANLLNEEGEADVDKIAELLINNYPDTRVVVRGHTGKGADEAASIKLSQERADAVVQRLIAVHGISENRLRAEGKGSSQPPEHRPGENQRAYMYRVPRVEFVLYLDNNF